MKHGDKPQESTKAGKEGGHEKMQGGKKESAGWDPKKEKHGKK